MVSEDCLPMPKYEILLWVGKGYWSNVLMINQNLIFIVTEKHLQHVLLVFREIKRASLIFWYLLPDFVKNFYSIFTVHWSWLSSDVPLWNHQLFSYLRSCQFVITSWFCASFSHALVSSVGPLTYFRILRHTFCFGLQQNSKEAWSGQCPYFVTTLCCLK